MKVEEKPLTVAEQFIVGHIRKWPSLYRNGRRVYHSSIVGCTGSFFWEDGLLVEPPNQNYLGTVDGEPQWGDYPDRISEEVARNFLPGVCSTWVSVNMPCHAKSPIMTIPDNAHKAWLDFIDMQLYLDSKLTPELYAQVVTAFCIMQYGAPTNPNASMGHYQYEWERYYAKISSIRARIRYIEDKQRTGQIPPDSFVGMGL